MTKYYTVNVEILVKADSEADAFDVVESYVDDMVSNTNEVQDYFLHESVEFTVRD
jgi:hypothetical protein